MPIISSQSKSIRWLLAELGVVILGILIAFQVEEWRSENADREKEGVALEALLLDLENETDSLNAFLNSAQRQIAALSIIPEIAENERSQDEEWVADIYRDAMLTQLWQPTATTYEGISSSGNLNLITNQELLGALITYYDRRVTGLSQLINDMRDARDEFLLVLGRDIHFFVTDEPGGYDSLNVNIVSPITNMPRHLDFYAYYGAYAYRISILRRRLETTLQENSELQTKVRDRILAIEG